MCIDSHGNAPVQADDDDELTVLMLFTYPARLQTGFELRLIEF